jgi:hypothetical protein
MKNPLLRSASISRVRLFAGVVTLVTCGGLVTIAACGGDDDAKGGASSSSGSSGASSSGGNGSSAGFINDSGDVPEADKPDACVAKEAQPIESTRPVDIIFAIDNSDSMAARIAAVESQINDNFAAIIAASGLDYRVIMLSNHGAHVDPVNPSDPLQRICVKGPLSGTNCNPIPPKPVETEHFIHHNIVINSTDSWCQILTSFKSPDKDGSHPQGWSQYLRQGAFKTFVVITDDQIATQCNPFNSPTPLELDDKATLIQAGQNAAGTFDSALLALSPTQFGTSATRNYVWHSIIGVDSFDAADKAKAYPPSAPINTNKCTPASVTPGVGYQALSRISGGLRYPVCGNDYTTIFQSMADDVIKKSHVACEYGIPDNPQGGKIDPDTAVIHYTGTSQEQDFDQVKDLASCAPDKFYIEGEKIKLCPDACTKISADDNAKVTILFGCLPKDGPTK